MKDLIRVYAVKRVCGCVNRTSDDDLKVHKVFFNVAELDLERQIFLVGGLRHGGTLHFLWRRWMDVTAYYLSRYPACDNRWCL